MLLFEDEVRRVWSKIVSEGIGLESDKVEVRLGMGGCIAGGVEIAKLWERV